LSRQSIRIGISSRPYCMLNTLCSVSNHLDVCNYMSPPKLCPGIYRHN
jgi:hypothetical protein